MQNKTRKDKARQDKTRGKKQQMSFAQNPSVAAMRYNMKSKFLSRHARGGHHFTTVSGCEN